MMGTTHALIGMLLAGSITFLRPELLFIAGIAGFTGGIFPDLDMPFDHRKTLHFPVYYSILCIPALIAAVVSPGVWTIGVFYFILGAAVHSVSDVFGGGLELRPWIPSSDEAVYDHLHQRYWKPKRWVRYDGAPEDLLLNSIAGALCFLIYPVSFGNWIVGIVTISAFYTLIRKQIPEWAPERFT